ncbi:MAG: cobalt-precorrin-6A reductase [Rhodococcus sp. (in: high G+C Gram-positive bacteria)]|nr:cobalt-precorrin-6A reductase [Rhodococcus sp. EPR-157]
MKILLLGGTTESRALAELLAADMRIEVVTSLAGRVRRPMLPGGAVRLGGFGGAEGLAGWIVDNDVDVVVDATHPFAAAITANAHAAATATDVPLVQLVRPEWRPEPGDDWVSAASVTEAASIVESTAQRAFLTIGRQGVNAFAHIERTWFLVRCIDPPEVPMPPNHRSLLTRGPFDVDDEIALLRDHRIDVVVSKNSGGAMTEAKIIAARALGVTVVMIERPLLPVGDVVTESPEAVVDWLRSTEPT